MTKTKKDKGFTLIELLIVVAIIWILAALLVPNAMTALQKAKVRSTQKDISTIATCLLDYTTDNSVPPVSIGAITTGGAVQKALSPMYIKVLPVNDQWGTAFQAWTGLNVNSSVYVSAGAASDDFLVASLGRDKAPEAWTYDATAPEKGLYTISVTADFDKDIVNWNGSFIHGPSAGGAPPAK